jgi:hypothetical protein
MIYGTLLLTLFITIKKGEERREEIKMMGERIKSSALI